MIKKIAVALVAAVLLMSTIPGARADGWNFIKAYNCYEYRFGGLDYLYITPTTGGFILTNDPTTITVVAPLCASGDGFYVYLSGTIWNGVSVYPPIK
jgi:hypothetical protein